MTMKYTEREQAEMINLVDNTKKKNSITTLCIYNSFRYKRFTNRHIAYKQDILYNEYMLRKLYKKSMEIFDEMF